MFCSECGSSIRDDAVFCPECGTKVDSSAASAPTEVIPPAFGQTKAMPQVAQTGAGDQPVEPSAPSSVDRVYPPAPSTSPVAPAAPSMSSPAKKSTNRSVLVAAIIAGAVVLIALIVAAVVIFTQPAQSSSTSDSATSKQSSQPAQNDQGSTQNVPSTNSSRLSDDYILPNSNRVYLTESDLAGLTDYELYLARNEIFARLGREFKNEDLQHYFNSKSWYRGVYSPDEFDKWGPELNSYEKKNTELIMGVEKRHNSIYLD